MKKLVCFALALCLLWGAGCLLPVRTNADSYILGDVNADGALNAQDALLILRAAVSTATPTDVLMMRGDWDRNGRLDANDARYVLKKAVQPKIHLTPQENALLNQYGKGNVNKDTALNAIDALYILQYCVKKRQLDAEQVVLADYDVNGVITAKDAWFCLSCAMEGYPPDLVPVPSFPGLPYLP